MTAKTSSFVALALAFGLTSDVSSADDTKSTASKPTVFGGPLMASEGGTPLVVLPGPKGYYRTVRAVPNTRLFDPKESVLTISYRTDTPEYVQRSVLSEVKGKIGASGDGLRYEGITQLKPNRVTIKVKDVTGKVVVERVFGDDTQEVSISALSSISLPVPKAYTPGDVKYFTVEAIFTYRVTGTETSFAKVEGATTAIINAIEQVAPGASTAFISKDTANRLSKSVETRISMKTFDANEEVKKLALEMFKNYQTQIFVEADKLIEKQEQYSIYTPAIGRLEITPDTFSNELNERIFSQEFAKGLEQNLRDLQIISDERRSFESWYTQVQEASRKKGAFSLFETVEAFIPEPVRGALDLKGDFDFHEEYRDNKKQVEDKYRKFYDHCDNWKQKKVFESGKQYEHWKGKNVSKGTKPKVWGFSKMASINDIRTLSAEFEHVKTTSSYLKSFLHPNSIGEFIDEADGKRLVFNDAPYEEANCEEVKKSPDQGDLRRVIYTSTASTKFNSAPKRFKLVVTCSAWADEVGAGRQFVTIVPFEVKRDPNDERAYTIDRITGLIRRAPGQPKDGEDRTPHAMNLVQYVINPDDMVVGWDAQKPTFTITMRVWAFGGNSLVHNKQVMKPYSFAGVISDVEY